MADIVERLLSSISPMRLDREAADEITRLRNQLHLAQEWSARVIAGQEQDMTEITRLRAEVDAIRKAIPDRFILDPPDGGDVKTVEGVQRMAAEVERFCKSRNRWGQKYNKLLGKHKADRTELANQIQWVKDLADSLIAEEVKTSALRAEVEKLKAAYSATQHDIQQTLGKALRYPWFKDDQKNFPNATEADGVCVGDHVAESLADEAAAKITALRAEVEDLGHRLYHVHRLWANNEHALRAENERLRTALKEIDSITVHSGGDIHGISPTAWRAAFNHAHAVARAALEEKP